MLCLTELGSRLKEARLSKGYSLDDLQDITKIQKRYLVGIEEGNYSIMPGSFYVRAFIKQYAEAVGLNADEILEQYKQEIPLQQTSEDVAQSISQTTTTRRRLSRTPSNKMMENMPKVIVALFIIVIIVAIWFLYQQKVSNIPEDAEEENVSQVEYEQQPTPIEDGAETEEAAEGTELTDEGTAADELAEEEPIEEEVTPSISEGEIQSDGETTIYQLSGTDTLNIRIEVSGETWVGIRNEQGAEQVNADVYTAGDVVEYDSTTNGYARIRLGNINNAKVFVNDQEIQYAQDVTTQNIVITLQEEQ